jgi:hypothetical protein
VPPGITAVAVAKCNPAAAVGSIDPLPEFATDVFATDVFASVNEALAV